MACQKQEHLLGSEGQRHPRALCSPGMAEYCGVSGLRGGEEVSLGDYNVVVLRHCCFEADMATGRARADGFHTPVFNPVIGYGEERVRQRHKVTHHLCGCLKPFLQQLTPPQKPARNGERTSREEICEGLYHYQCREIAADDQAGGGRVLIGETKRRR